MQNSEHICMNMYIHGMNMYTVCTWYIPGLSIHIPVVPTCFRGQHRDRVWSDHRVPLIPLFLAGNSTPTIPHEYSQHKRSGFPVGSCDTAAADGRRGSNVYEVNPWLWQFGRGKQRLGGLSVEKTDDRKEAAQKERIERGAETRWRRKADLA